MVHIIIANKPLAALADTELIWKAKSSDSAYIECRLIISDFSSKKACPVYVQAMLPGA
jgi:hypothetical protein